MATLQTSWFVLLGVLSLSLHGLIIDDWTRCHCHALAIEILAWSMTGLLFVATVVAFLDHTNFQGFLWALITLTSGCIALAENGIIDPETLAISWGIVMLLLGTVGICCVSFNERLDWRTLFYIMGLLITLGCGTLFAIGHSIQLAATGILVAVWSITIPFIGFTCSNIINRNFTVGVALTIAISISIGVLISLFEHHTVWLLVLSWIFQLCVWISWYIIRK